MTSSPSASGLRTGCGSRRAPADRRVRRRGPTVEDAGRFPSEVLPEEVEQRHVDRILDLDRIPRSQDRHLAPFAVDDRCGHGVLPQDRAEVAEASVLCPTDGDEVGVQAGQMIGRFKLNGYQLLGTNLVFKIVVDVVALPPARRAGDAAHRQVGKADREHHGAAIERDGAPQRNTMKIPRQDPDPEIRSASSPPLGWRSRSAQAPSFSTRSRRDRWR